jgi:3'-phosphoadenosine 5'-phosphosulfate sulfotransferase
LHETTWQSCHHQYQVSARTAFSQGEITISKCRNCLKGDIVEALQCIKCAIRHDLLFREPAPSSILEMEEASDRELENASTQEDSREPDEESDIEEFSWDELLTEDEDEEAMYCSE